jgi:CDP-6-deoxy-D-xylo-4-hexulose-3-dehydrase
MGQGGGVFTNNKELARKVKMYRDWGRQANLTSRTNNKWKSLPKDYDSRFIYEKVGYNLSPLDLQAAMGRVQLRRTNEIKKLRKANFDYLYKELSKIPQLTMPKWLSDADVCWFSFPLYTKERGKLCAFLEEKRIETRSMMSGNILKHPAYAKVKYRVSGKLTEANKILKYGMWVGVHPRMTQEDREYMVKCFNDFYA